MIPWFQLEPWTLPLSLPWIGAPKIQPFGVLAAVAIMVGAHFAQRRASQLQIDRRLLSDFLTTTTLWGLVGAYVLNAVFYFPAELLAALSDPRALLGRYWGLSSYGGFLAGTVAAVVFVWRRRVPLSPLADIWCYAIPFAWIFARMGCFVVHDHPGHETDFFLAVADWHGSGVARHDLGLYEVLWSLAVAPLFLALSRSGRPVRPAGYFTLRLLLLYGPLRFVLDFLRADSAHGGDARYLGLTPAQYASLAITAIALWLWLRRSAGVLPARPAITR